MKARKLWSFDKAKNFLMDKKDICAVKNIFSPDFSKYLSYYLCYYLCRCSTLETSSRRVNKMLRRPTTETSWRCSTGILLGVSFEMCLQHRWEVVMTWPRRLVAGWEFISNQQKFV